MRRHRLALAALVFIPAAAPLRADFIRGDASFDGRVNVLDAIAVLQALFRGGSLACLDAADANDDGRLGAEDAILILEALFRTGAAPSLGSLSPGPDPTCDSLDCEAAPDVTPAVLLSEVYYNPPGLQSGEFIELHNRAAEPVPLAGYRLTGDMDFEFPDDAVLTAGEFALLLKNPSDVRWRRLTLTKFGPYEGTLPDGGGQLTLSTGCSAENVEYSDRAPWPIAADGGAASLERIDYAAPADDFHAWRASLVRQGTPGEANSTAGTPARPLIADIAFTPAVPSSRDAVQVEVQLDVPAPALAKVTLHWEVVEASASPASAVEMTAARAGDGWSMYAALLPAQKSQVLVRMNFEVELAGGQTLILPHLAEPRGFASYFVYDFDMPAKLPILWLFGKRRTGLPGPARYASAAVVLEPPGSRADRWPLVFDGADVRTSRQGTKLKFLKGEEYRGDRTLNIIREEGGGGTGMAAPHMEHLGFVYFRELGAIAPRVDWFRVVDYGSGRRHSQRLVIQQISERFLEMNRLDPEGDLYKYVYQGLEKHTNLETGTRSWAELTLKLRSPDPAVRRETVLNELDVENIGLYSIASVLMANWDGFHNNVYFYKDLRPGSRWKAIPWDLDQVFEVGCAQMPVLRPLTGEGCNSREPGVISRPYHSEPDLHEAYLQGLRDRIAPGGLFSREAVRAKIDAIEALLLEDVTLLETYLAAPSAARRAQIRNAYSGMRSYLGQRIAYLEGELGP